ncbi:MAG TPA: hypothetical protein VFG42_07765 [Baekduia sp.]|uniref:hypothetical protein n=1 Tax=Baekduia sp. TaxID=2600305 RepID=UPI002D797061|nr:hypothetical protein [Baekduia sp.]HET6506670.1 hypothetical protein [Baekduia sp.]
MADIQVGDVVLARGATGPFHAVVSGIRLGRLAVERCDGRPSGPLPVRDVVTVFKPSGRPGPEPPRTQRLRPSAQLKLDLD